jgi:hypothetical protein
MLQRVGPDTFEAPTGDTIQVIAIASNNGGLEVARFRYGADRRPATTILTHPGCSFVVKTPVTMLGCVVVFAPGAATARYDFFEVDANGTTIDLQVSAADPAFGPLVQFRIRGVAVPAMAGAAAPRGLAPAARRRSAPPPPPPPRPKAAKKKPAKKKPAAKKPAAKKPAKRKPAATKKKTGGRTSRKRTRGGR